MPGDTDPDFIDLVARSRAAFAAAIADRPDLAAAQRASAEMTTAALVMAQCAREANLSLEVTARLVAEMLGLAFADVDKRKARSS